MSVRVCLCDFNLDEGESGSRGEGFILVFNLVSQVLLHSFLLKHLLLALSPKQDPRGNSDGHCVLWLWLQKKRHQRENGVTVRNRRKGRAVMTHWDDDWKTQGEEVKGVRGMDEPIFTCGAKLTLKVNLANNTLNVSFLQVHAYTSAAEKPWGATSWKLYLDAAITTHAELHAKKCDTFQLLSCLSSAVMPL